MDNSKIALVTGASRGIGKAILQKLAEDDFMVIGTATTDENVEKINSFLAENNLSGKGMKLNLLENANIQDFIKDIINEFSGIDILVNNAAITQDNLLLRMKDNEWQDVINVNLNSIFYLTKGLIKPMIKRRWGRIINISSVVAFMGNPGQANYCAAKAGILGFSKSLSIEIANRNITVNTVAPGFIDTDMTKILNEQQKEAILATVPMNKLGKSEDIAHVVSFLASEKSGYITGQTIHVNGGMYTS
ncbi:MAG: 3-oxoacyl-ACP reductase FabG [Legionellales bacterium]|nr:3-oxoacyl-ACP reductase FabG [Legionellales bacterium]